MTAVWICLLKINGKRTLKSKRTSALSTTRIPRLEKFAVGALVCDRTFRNCPVPRATSVPAQTVCFWMNQMNPYSRVGIPVLDPLKTQKKLKQALLDLALKFCAKPVFAPRKVWSVLLLRCLRIISQSLALSMRRKYFGQYTRHRWEALMLLALVSKRSKASITLSSKVVVCLSVGLSVASFSDKPGVRNGKNL